MGDADRGGLEQAESNWVKQAGGKWVKKEKRRERRGIGRGLRKWPNRLLGIEFP
jgi:hypothetical protein